MGHLVVNLFRQKYRIPEVVKLLFSYTKFLGSSVIEEVDGQWSLSSSLLAFNFFVSLTSSLALYLTFTNTKVSSDDSYLLDSLHLVNQSLLFVSRILNLFSQLVNLEQIRHIMESFKSVEIIILNIDSKQSSFDGPPMHCYMVNNFILIFSISLGLFTISFDFRSLASMLHIFYLPIVRNMDIYTICVLIYCVQVNLSYLNSCLETMKSTGCKQGKVHDASVEYCCKAYNQLCLQVDRINTVYGLQLLVVFINIFIVLVDELYHLIYLKSSDQLWVQIWQVLFLLARLIFTLSHTFLITSSCDRTVVKAKEFNTLLYEVMISDKTYAIAKNKKMRLHGSMKREIMFTAYGFFSIDYTLVHSIAAAATTYLVILIQFVQPSPKVNETN